MESGIHQRTISIWARRDPRGWWAAAWRATVAGRYVLLVGVVTILGGAIRWWGLGAKSLWIDETFSIGMVSQSWSSFFATVGGVQPNMEAFYLVLKIWRMVTPVSWHSAEWFWRALPALAGTLTIPATAWLTRRLYGPVAAVLAALLVAANEFQVEYAQQARGYTLFVLLLILSYIALERWVTRGDRRALIAFAALAAVGFLTQAFEVVFLTGQIAWLIAIDLRWRGLARRAGVNWRPLALALLGILAVVAWRYPIYAAHSDQVAWIPRPTTTDLFHGLRQLAGGDGGTPSRIGDGVLVVLLLAALGLTALVLWQLVAAWRQHTATDRRHASPVTGMDDKLATVDAHLLVLCWLAIPVLGTWIGSQIKPVWVTRYLAPTGVAASICVAVAIASLAHQLPWQRWRPVALLGMLAISVTLQAGPLHDYLARPGWEDWRGAAQYVDSQYQAGDGIVCYDNQWGCDFGFSVYFHHARLDPNAPGAFSWATYGRPDREAIFARAVDPTALAPYLAAHGRVWVLLGHYLSGQGHWQATLGWLNQHAHLIKRVDFRGDVVAILYQAP